MAKEYVDLATFTILIISGSRVEETCFQLNVIRIMKTFIRSFFKFLLRNFPIANCSLFSRDVNTPQIQEWHCIWSIKQVDVMMKKEGKWGDYCWCLLIMVLEACNYRLSYIRPQP